MSEEILKELLREYKKNHIAMLEECKSIDEQILNLQAYRKSLAEPYQNIFNDIEMKARLIMNDRKKSFKSDNGKITYYSAGVKRSWNLDALDSICDSNPTVKQFIWPFRKAEPFDARILIKVD